MSKEQRYIPDYAGAWKAPGEFVVALVQNNSMPQRLDLIHLNFMREGRDRAVPCWGEGQLQVEWNSLAFLLLPEELRRTAGRVACDPYSAWEVLYGAPTLWASDRNWAKDKLDDLRRMLAEPHHSGHPLMAGGGYDTSLTLVKSSWLVRVKQLLADPDGAATNEGRKP